jgi:sterol desaturase/sphingolipid hydroxylase (fatty acid hydroxylase superfamily)
MEQLIQVIVKISGITLLRYFILAGIAFALFYVLLPARFKRAKIQNRSASRKDFIREILHSIATSLVLSVIGCMVLYTPLRSYTLIYAHLNDYPYWWIPVSLFISLVVHDTYFYWMHRLLHHKRIFKYTHLVHHQSTNPSPWASYSFHTLEAIAEGSVVIFLSFILPMHPLTVILFVILGFMINVYGHLGYELMPKGLRRSFLFNIINTSVYHNLHHSKFKGNYSLYFRWWDKWMGTENPDYEKEYDRIQEKRFGTA